MPTTTLRKMLDPKVWTPCAPPLVINSANQFVVDSYGPDQLAYYFTGVGVTAYDPYEDAWLYLPSSGLSALAAGACGRWHDAGPTGTALAGSTSTTLNTATNICGNLDARSNLTFWVRITGGTGAGQLNAINGVKTYGANAVLNVRNPWTTVPDATSTYQLYTGRVWFLMGGTLGTTSFKYWDYATQTWSAGMSVTGLPATFGTDGRLIGTSVTLPIVGPVPGGTATSATSTTLTCSSKTWTVNGLANMSVIINSGTGAGQTRTIASNTANTLTVSTAWTTVPDATSVFVVSPNDDYLYLIGNGAVTLYRYSISGNTWVTLTPTTARATVASAGSNLHWVFGCSDPAWVNESTYQQGRYLYSTRPSALDRYDIALNTWTSGIALGGSGTEQLAANGVSCSYDWGDYLIIKPSSAVSAPARFLRIDIKANRLEPLAVNTFPAPTADTLGDRTFILQYGDSTGVIKFLYYLQPGGSVMQRMAIW